jgi:hypothetical protein
MSKLCKTFTFGPDDHVIQVFQHAMTLAQIDQEALGEAVASVGTNGARGLPLVRQARSLIAQRHPEAADALDRAAAEHVRSRCDCWRAKANAFATEVEDALRPNAGPGTYWVHANERTGLIERRPEAPGDLVSAVAGVALATGQVTVTFDPDTCTGTVIHGTDRLHLYRFAGRHCRDLLGRAQDIDSLDQLLTTPPDAAQLLAQLVNSDTTTSEAFGGEHLNLLDLAEVTAAAAPLLTTPTRMEQAAALAEAWVGSVEELARVLDAANVAS